MFKKLTSGAPRRTVTFFFDGETIVADEGMSVAAALFSHGIKSIRKTPVSRSERGPFCMMGSCYDCLISIDGLTVQACQIPVSEGLLVSRVDVTDHTPSASSREAV
ncbi:MAG: (2Fe-2S)-binding protein [Pseudomonadota bacterium]